MTQNAALAGRIRQSAIDLARVVERAEELMRKARQSNDDGYLDGVALNLHGFYAGAERIFEDIARNVDDAVPSDAEWHRALLLQMSASIEGVRPPVISRETRYCLDEYRGFRHVVRNVYTFNLKPSRLQLLTDELRACYESLLGELNTFIIFLEHLADSTDVDSKLKLS